MNEPALYTQIVGWALLFLVIGALLWWYGEDDEW